MSILSSNDSQVDILIKSTADTKGVDQTRSSMEKLDTTASLSGSSLSMLGSVASVAAAGITIAGTALIGAAAAGIKAAGSYEQSRIAFETMLGSADTARTMMSQIAEFAKSTPFELPEVVSGTKQLLAFGFAQEELIPTMRKLGDLASGLGVPVGQLTNVFGQVKVAGRLMGQDLLQFTNAGVPMIEALATTMKKPQSDIKKLVEQGKIGFPEVQTALESLTGEGSKFGGMMEKQSKSFNGVVSNIKDGFGQILRSAVGISVAGDIVEGGIFDRVKDAANAALPAVQRFAEKVGPFVQQFIGWMRSGYYGITAFFSALQDPDVTSDGFVGMMERLASSIRNLWDQVSPILIPAFKELWKTIQTQLLPTLKKFWAEHGPEMIKLLKVVGVILGVSVVAAIYTFVNTLNLMINIITKVIQFFSWWSNVVDSFKQKFVDAFRAIQNFVMQWGSLVIAIISSVFQSLIGHTSGFVTGATSKLATMYNAITGPISQAISWVQNTFNAMVGWFSGLGPRIMNSMGNIFGYMIAPFQGVLNWISNMPYWIAGSLSNIGWILRNAIGNIDIPGPLGLVRNVIPGFATGGFTGLGGTNEIAGVVHKGEYVIPQSQVDQSTGLPKNTTTNNRQVSIGNVYLGDRSAVKEWFDQLDSDALLTGRGLSPNRGTF